MFKVISGDYKGKKFMFTPNEKIRPTSSLVKESVFNIIQFDIVNSSFLDLFFGSGQIGIEALSRGASHVTFVDHDLYCKKCLIDNLNLMKVGKNYNIVNLDVLLYISKCRCLFNIVFLDPPYNLGISDKILNSIVHNMKKRGIIIAETGKTEILKEKYDTFKLYKQYIYGRKKLSVYKEGISK